MCKGKINLVLSKHFGLFSLSLSLSCCELEPFCIIQITHSAFFYSFVVIVASLNSSPKKKVKFDWYSPMYIYSITLFYQLFVEPISWARSHSEIHTVDSLQSTTSPSTVYAMMSVSKCRRLCVLCIMLLRNCTQHSISVKWNNFEMITNSTIGSHESWKNRIKPWVIHINLFIFIHLFGILYRILREYIPK